MEQHPLIRKIYLYFFSLLGLILFVIGVINFLNMGLKTFVFTRAEEEERIMYSRYNYNAPYPIERIKGLNEEELSEFLSEEEKKSIKELIINYETWKENDSKIDPVASRRHREASLNLSLILVGLPLYFFHWRIIVKEIKKKMNEKQNN